MTIFKRLRKSELARDTTHLSIGQGARLVTQAAYFVLVARSLGPDSYGAFVAAVALAAAISPFAGLGTPNLFIKNVRSGKRQAALCWGNGLLMAIVSGAFFSLAVAAVALLFHLKNSLWVVFIVCVSDLLLMKITELAAFGFAAVGRMKDTAILSVIISVFRLAGIAILSAVQPKITLDQWVVVYLLASVLGAAYVIVRGTRLWGAPEINMSALRDDVSEGVFFSISASATSIYNDIDKIMLGQMSNFAATGIYGAAYRVIDVSMTPVRSLISAAYPVFFEKGTEGLRPAYAYARRLIAKASIYGTVIFVSLWLTAPILPRILGPQYEAAIPALRWLALIPFLRCFHAFLADSLSGSGHQRMRTAVQVFVGIVNVAANFLLLPRYSWRGAAWTSLGCDGLLVVLFWVLITYLIRREALPAAAPLELAEMQN